LRAAFAASIFGPSPSSPASAQDDFYCFKDDAEVKNEGAVFDVVKVVLEFFHGVFNRGAVGEVDLRPAGQAGFYQVPV